MRLARHDLWLLLVWALAACSPPPLHTQQAYVFGTLVEVSVYGAPEAQAQQATAAVLALRRAAPHPDSENEPQGGDCYKDAVAESFFSNLKNEPTWHHDFRHRDEARATIFDYIEQFYNRQRRHSHLGGKSPETFEAASQRRH